jgi:hypothetical protein
MLSPYSRQLCKLFFSALEVTVNGEHLQNLCETGSMIISPVSYTPAHVFCKPVWHWLVLCIFHLFQLFWHMFWVNQSGIGLVIFSMHNSPVLCLWHMEILCNSTDSIIRLKRLGEKMRRGCLNSIVRGGCLNSIVGFLVMVNK